MTARLILHPAAPVYFGVNEILVDRKMHQGVVEFSRQFSGDVIVFCRSGDIDSFNFDSVPVTDSCITYLDGRKCDLVSIARPGDVVLLAADDRLQLRYIRGLKLKRCIVFLCVENTLSTRERIMRVDGRGLFRYCWGLIILLIDEIRLLFALRLVCGVQCNGFPAFLRYSKFAKNSICYFDSRISRCDLLGNGVDRVFGARPLQIAFSGRVIAIKGAQYIIPFAVMLRARGVDFVLNIYGDGDLLPSIRDDVDRHNLSDYVHLHGSVDFQTVLIPAVRDSTDILFMPNIQGDPSCTYFETLSLGVPILGFANDSWRSIYEYVGSFAGWIVPIGDLVGAMNCIVWLASSPNELEINRRSLLEWGKGQTMERQFFVRASQLNGIQCSGL